MPLFQAHPKAVNKDINKISWVSRCFCEVLAIITPFTSSESTFWICRCMHAWPLRPCTWQCYSPPDSWSRGSYLLLGPLAAYRDIKDRQHKMTSQWSNVWHLFRRGWTDSDLSFLELLLKSKMIYLTYFFEDNLFLPKSKKAEVRRDIFLHFRPFSVIGVIKFRGSFHSCSFLIRLKPPDMLSYRIETKWTKTVHLYLCIFKGTAARAF